MWHRRNPGLLGLRAGLLSARRQFQDTAKEPLGIVGLVALAGFVAYRVSLFGKASGSSGWGASITGRLLALLVCWFFVSTLRNGKRGPKLFAAEREWFGVTGVSLVDLLAFRTARQLGGTLLTAVTLSLIVESTSVALLIQRCVGFVVLLLALSFGGGVLQMTQRVSSRVRGTLLFGAVLLLLLELAGDILACVRLLLDTTATVPTWLGQLAASQTADALWIPASVLSAGVGGGAWTLLLGGQLTYGVACILLWRLAKVEGGDWSFIDQRTSSSSVDSAVVRGAIRFLQPAVESVSSLLGQRVVPLAVKNTRVFCRSQPIAPLLISAVGLPAATFVYRIPQLEGTLEFVLGLVSVFGLYLTLAGPLLVRADVRVSIPAISYLRLIPMKEWRVLAAENVPSVLILTYAQCGFLTVLSLSLGELIPFSAVEMIALVLACVCFLFVFNGANVTLHSVLAFSVPSLTKIGPWAPEDRSAMTRNYLALVSSCVAGLALLTVPVCTASVIHTLVVGTVLNASSSWVLVSVLLSSAVIQSASCAILSLLASRLMADVEPR